MAELKVTSKKYNDKDVLEVENFDSEVGKVIQADKEIISKIKVEYVEEDGVTYFNFPKGIAPLEITLNTHKLYFKEGQVVGHNGQSIEGYEKDEAIFDADESYVTFLGDLSEQVINGLVYINFGGNDSAVSQLLFDSYYLFYPKKVGTKLYKHSLVVADDENNQFPIVVISKSRSTITFSHLATQLEDVVSFVPINNPNGYTLLNIIHDTKSYYNSIAFDYQHISLGYIGVENVVSDTVTEL